MQLSSEPNILDERSAGRNVVRLTVQRCVVVDEPVVRSVIFHKVLSCLTNHVDKVLFTTQQGIVVDEPVGQRDSTKYRR